MTWQPIETAPKDGTDIVTYDAVTGAIMVLAYWTQGGWCDYLTDEEWQPTHWMPLPPPPVD